MKRLLTVLATCMIFASSAFAASRFATEAWVKDYVSKHAGTNAVSPSSSKYKAVTASQIVDGTNVTFSYTIYYASEPSWKIIESTIPGMDVGTHFAIDEYGNACNYTNAACNMIHQSISTNWTVVTKGVTNVRNVVQFDFSVNGNEYRGWENPNIGVVSASGVTTNAPGYVRFVRSYVLPSVKRKLLTPPNQVSWLELLIPSASAGWVLEEWWIDTTEEAASEIIYHWKAHYYWDGSDCTVEIPTLTGTYANGSTINYTIDASYAISVPGGEYCKKGSPDMKGAVDGVNNEIESKARASMGEDSVAYKMFKRMSDSGMFDAQTALALKSALDPYLNDKMDCPEKQDTTEPKPEDPEEPVTPTPPDPVRPPNNICPHTSVKCTSTDSSCIFSCAVCGKVLQSGTHNYSDSAHNCAVCQNSYRGKGVVKCGKASKKRSDHEFGPQYGGNAEGCYCKHHHVWAPHPSTTLVKNREFDATHHWDEHRCNECGYSPIIKEKEKHVMMEDRGPYSYPDRCELSNECMRCYYSSLSKICGHIEPEDPALLQYVYKDNGNHDIYYTCEKCHRPHIYKDTKPHVDSKITRSCVYLDETYHWFMYICSSTNGCGCPYYTDIQKHANFKPNGLYRVHEVSNNYHWVLGTCGSVPGKDGCGCELIGGLESCQGGYDGASRIVLVDDVNAKDYYPCQKCTGGHAKDVPHKWSFNRNQHWCVNDKTREHLRGDHTFVSNICTVCGCSLTGIDDDEYKREYGSVSCKDSNFCCHNTVTVYHRRCMTNGVEIAEKDRGDWITDGPQYIYGVQADGIVGCSFPNGDSCRCPYCRGDKEGLLYNSCYCPRMYGGMLVKLTMSDVVSSYFRAYMYSKALLVDMEDPVYNVGDSCFEEAFISMPNLVMVKCGATTNVGNSAFERAFTNCTKLSSVDFGALEYAGNYAFSEAFVGCPLDSGVNVKTLLTCGIHGFLGAFKGTRISSLSFDSLVDPNGSLDIFEGTPCVTMRTLSAPKLNYNAFGPVFNFADMPNLQTLNLRGASSNVVSHIGDMSGLSKLTRIDLHEMTEIPSYSQTGASTGVHAPTNNPNCMIVVSDELWPAWCNAPGWIDIENQVVPYSNQVIRPISWCTVAFDADGGSELENVMVKYGKSIVAPTNIFKWGETEYTAETTDGAFTLEGWYTNAERTVRYTGWPVTTNTTLYAKWNDNRRIDCNFGLYSSYYGSDYYTADCHSDIEFYNTRLGLGEIVPCRMRFLSSNQTGSWMYYSLNFYIDEYGRQNGCGFIPSFCGLFSENGIDVDIDYPDRMELTVECPDGSYFYTTNGVSVRFD